MRVVWVGMAGFVGAICRYLLDGVVSRTTTGSFPWGTIVVNLSGCFLIGLLTTVLTQRLLPNPTVRIAITIGFIGAYTTFSTFAYETLQQLQEGSVAFAFANVAASVVLGIAAAWVGVIAGRTI